VLANQSTQPAAKHRNILLPCWQAKLTIAAGAGTSAMTAEPCWKPKIRGAAWRRSCGTGSAAREKQGTAVGSAVLLLHGLQATATGTPRSLRHWQTPARKPASEQRSRDSPHRISSAHALASKASFAACLVCGLLLTYGRLMGRVLVALGTEQWRRCLLRQSEKPQPPIKG
jgi:hypothetical protein